MGLTVSQIFSKPVEQFKTHIDPQTGVPIAAQMLKEGCGILSAQIKDPRFNVELLLGAMVTDAETEKQQAAKLPKNSKAPVTGDKLLKKVDFAGLLNAYKLFCKGDTSVADKINLVEVINYYNSVYKNLKDVNSLKNLKLSEATMVMDAQGKPFNEMYGAANRRLVVPIAKIPAHVRQAFVSAEDQNFYSHKGVDIKGLMRAFTTVAGGSGSRPQGGSTITQQVVKNMLINDDLTVERKMREMLLAVRLEKVMTKDQILELYLNYVFLGRASWGVEMAARSYFGPQATTANLTIEQAAMLAALTKGPTYYNPDRQPERARDRRQYVLNRMREDCEAARRGHCPTPQQINDSANKPLGTVKFESPTTKGGFYFMDAIQKETKALTGLDLKSESTHVVQSTINPVLQRATEQAVREGLMDYEANTGRKVWTGPQGSIANDINKYKMKWEEVLPRVQPRLYDIPWTIAVVLDVGRAQVGLPDGKIVSLRAPGSVLRRLKAYDLIFVDVTGADKKQIATLKIPARVQGSAVILENQTGKVLAISGGFSYASSEYNRAMLAMRQPGSTLKPFVYLSALNVGLQPNTLLPDMPHDPPLSKNWQPKNYDRLAHGLVTFRTAIENSLNLPTIQLASRLGGKDPYAGLSYVQSVLKSVGLYKGDQQRRDFAEVLGSRETRLIDVATAYAAVANSGLRPTPYFIESISKDGRAVYTNNKPKPVQVERVDRVAFYQLKKILEGTVARGTATRLKKLEGFIAGKTGTSNDESDAWFVVFTNDITVAVWVGYDDRKIHYNLGGGSTGGRVALPIAEKILKASFDSYKKPTKLNGPPDEIKSQVTELKINLKTGSFEGGNFMETFRIDRNANSPLDTTHALLKPGEETFGMTEEPISEEDAPLVEPQPAATQAEPQIRPEPEQTEPQRRQQDPEAQPYRPGADDSYQLWRLQPRKVDPLYQENAEQIFYVPTR